MLDPSLQLKSPADWLRHRSVQKVALSNNLCMKDITIAVVGDNASFFYRGSRVVATVDAALSLMPFDRPSDEVIRFLGNCFMINRLIPVADPWASGTTWPTIVVPSKDELDFFCDTDADGDAVLEILSDWRAHVDECASALACDPLGWIGGIWVFGLAG
jgi:hypothetical protein